jgi:hypothetical protein
MPMADPSLLTKTSGQASQTSSSPETISRESILDSLKLVVIGAPLGELLRSLRALALFNPVSLRQSGHLVV